MSVRAVRVRITEKRLFPVNYLGKGNFFLLTTFPGRGRNMVRLKKWTLFFGPKFSVFGPKIRFLIWDRDFRQWTVCSPRRCGRFGAFGSIFRLFVPELWPFSWPPGRKMAIFGMCHPCKEVPLILVRIGRNLVGSSG